MANVGADTPRLREGLPVPMQDAPVPMRKWQRCTNGLGRLGARYRGTQYQQAVLACRGDLERALGLRLAFDVTEIGMRAVRALVRRHRRGLLRQQCAAGEVCAYVEQNSARPVRCAHTSSSADAG